MKTEQSPRRQISLPEIVGKGYGTYWRYEGRYRVCKGSRASKKSKTTALNLITRLMCYAESNALVVRKVFRTIKDSCFADLKWAIRRLEVERYWDAKESPLELVYKPTGQKILFRGLDDPLKIASITVERGYLCFMWIEEAYEITNEADFNMLDESIRGQVPSPLFKQITLTFNPWNERHWLKQRFFDEELPDVLAQTTTYKQNEWLDEGDRRVFSEMKERNPRRYKVAGLGQWGTAEGLIYENWLEESFKLSEVFALKELRTVIGLDFGYTLDPSALFVGFAHKDSKTIYVYDEMYERALSNELIYQKVFELGYAKEVIIADSAEPKSIDRLRDLGLRRIRASRKGADSVRNGIDYLQDWQIKIHPRCVNFLTEISNYGWDKDRLGNLLNRPAPSFDHMMDAFRYGMEPLMLAELYSFD